MKKEWSIIITLKNRTMISVDYEPIPIRVLNRHKLQLSGFKKEVKTDKNGRIILTLLLDFLESLQKVKLNDEVFEIVIVDFRSDDYDLNLLSTKYPQLEFKIIYCDEYFSRGRGLNLGYQHSTKENLFFADADMMVTDRNLFDIAYEVIDQGKVLFPICKGLTDPSHQLYYLRSSGYGLNLMSRNLLEKTNFRWPEYDATGQEDNVFWTYFEKLDLCVRTNVDNYYHCWHPETTEFKNRYYKCNDINKKKFFVNCENLDDILKNEQLVNKIKLSEKLENLNDVYIVNKLERFINVIITFDNIKSIVTNDDINNYKQTFNKNVRIVKL